MKLKNLSSNNYLALEFGDLPDYSDSTTFDSETQTRERTQSLDPFSTVSQLEIGSQIELIDDNNNRTLATFTISKRYYFNGKNFYSVNEITSTPPQSKTIKPRTVLGTYTIDGESESWDTPISNQTFDSFDNIESKFGESNNNNSLSFNFNDGIISISRNLETE